MSIDFSFVEYSAPLEFKDQLIQRLTILGFIPRVSHIKNDVTLWCQNHTIIMVNHCESVDTPGISGLGFITSQSTIDQIGAMLDPMTNMYRTVDSGSMKVLLAPVDDTIGLQGALDENYILLDDSLRRTPGLKYISGIRYNSSNPRMMDFYQDLGFGFMRSSDRYNTLVSKNRRFSMMCNKASEQGLVSTLICDTNDVFATTAAFVAKNIKLVNYDIEQHSLSLGKLNHKVIGYNCLAQGTEDSYSIENFIPQALPNLDIVFRMRKRYLNITEHTLDYHYDTKSHTDNS